MEKTLSVLALLIAFSAAAYAESYSFACISNNNAANCASGAAQLRVEVLNSGSGQALFQFYNIGTIGSSIADIYFDDGTLLGIAQLNNTSGVNFKIGRAHV